LSGLFPVAGDFLGPGAESALLRLQGVGQFADLPVKVGVLRGQLTDRLEELGLIRVVRRFVSLRDLAHGLLIRGVPLIGRSVNGHVSRLRTLVALC
jgi:hypothetical protein